MRISDWSSDVCSSDLDDQIGAGFINDVPYPPLLRGLGRRRHRQVLEWNVAEIDPGIGYARMVGDDAHRLHRQFADPPPVDKVRQAMIELRRQKLGRATCRDRMGQYV